MRAIKSNCWYKLDGKFFFVKNVTAEGIVFSSKDNPSHTWVRTGKEAWYFKNKAEKVTIREVEDKERLTQGSHLIVSH